MGELTHKAARAAFGGAIDLAMRKMDKDREKGLLDLVDPVSYTHLTLPTTPSV